MRSVASGRSASSQIVVALRRPAPHPRRRAESSGTSGCEHDDRASGIARNAFEEIEQVVFRPVDVLDEHEERPVGRQLLDELDGRFVQLLPSLERMQLSGDVEAERQAQDLPLAESLADRLRWVAVMDAELLPHDLAQRPVRDPVAVGETTTRPAQWRRLLLGEQLPELADEARLPDARARRRSRRDAARCCATARR